MRRAPAIAVVAALLLGAGPSAAVAGPQRLVRIDLPSAGNVDVTKVKLNGTGRPQALVANVLLPKDYDSDTAYPVLYLLHGSGENYASWVTKTHADELTKDLGAIVVMPDAGSGFYVNHYNGGQRGNPGWERYFLDEVIPAIEQRYKIRPERRWHAIAGFSMGGYGAAYLSSQLPGYFGAVAPMSGFLAPLRPEMRVLFQIGAGQPFEPLFGPFGGPYSVGHDPISLAGNLAHARVFVISGNGVPDPAYPASTGTAALTDSAGEAELQFHSDDFAAAARTAGAEVSQTKLLGVHSHPYWHEHLRRFLAWGAFKDVPDTVPSWSYRTIADRGRAWEVSYRFAGLPTEVATLRRGADGYSAEGAGTIELCGPGGLGLRSALPFKGKALTRSVRVRFADTRWRDVIRRGRLRLQVRATEATEVTIATLTARRRVKTYNIKVDVPAGATRTVRLPLTVTGRRLLRGGTRVRAHVTYGGCPGRRYSDASRRLR